MSKPDVPPSPYGLPEMAPRRGFLRGLASLPLIGGVGAVPALAALRSPAVAQTATRGAGRPGHAQLLALSRKFGALWEKERDAFALAGEAESREADEIAASAAEATKAVAEQILSLPATTLEGLKVKAQCILWCYGGDASKIDLGDTTAERLAASMARDLLALSGPIVSAGRRAGGAAS